MAIEKTDGGGFVVTGRHIELYRLKTIQSALALEINTGMKMSRGGSVMKAAAATAGSSKRTKRGVLADLVAYTEKEFPGAAILPSAKKALERKK